MTQTMTDRITLYSIGHSNVAVERLISLLNQHAIMAICDVRSMPYSRYNPQFNREALAASLRPTGIAYYYMGDALGGMPANDNLRAQDGARPGHAKIAASPAFISGIDRLIGLGARVPAAFMCGEADYRPCHRHRLITPALIERGVAVLHIMADGSLERGAIEPRQLPMFEL